MVRAQSGNGRIVLDAASAGAMEVAVREISVCVNGVEKRMLVIASEPYDA